jgi:hypothetical protein
VGDAMTFQIQTGGPDKVLHHSATPSVGA